MKEKFILQQTKGITIIALIITIIIMLILASVTIQFGVGEVQRAKLEDIKTTMLLIKGRAQIVADKDSFGESYDSTGMLKLVDASGYDLSLLQPILSELEDNSNLYIWEQTAMDNNNIDVEITTEDFFVIDYSTGEVYYSLGYTYEGNTYYSLTRNAKYIGEVDERKRRRKTKDIKRI
ncbi:MAG: hypothetical protein J6A29_05645 [Clostridia bacterium]|nr:hypothetical protein [Clostridia bacterium]